MERLLLVRCPELLVEDEGGVILRTFVQVTDAVRTYCPWVTAVRAGICTLPIRGPSRFFGGESAVTDLVLEAAEAAAGGTPVEVGIADGLFAAHLAAQNGLIIPPGETATFLARWPLSALERPDLEELLRRLGIYTLGAFADLPEGHVLARLGNEGVACHRIARAIEGELPGLRETATQERIDRLGVDTSCGIEQVGFWGGHRDSDTRAIRALVAVQELLGVDAVQVATRQGGRSPAQQTRFITWAGPDRSQSPLRIKPWPGQIPSPAPSTIYVRPIQVEIIGDAAEPVTVTGRGSLNTPPSRMSIGGAPWTPVVAWAGPWPALEQWWRANWSRSARMQVVTAAQLGHLLTTQRGKWWLTATYD